MSAQLNASTSWPIHEDKNNFSRSWLIGFGSYEGGCLWVEDPLGKKRWEAATMMLGTWVQFDPQTYHCVEPVTKGERSVALFTPRRWKRLRAHSLGSSSTPLPPLAALTQADEPLLSLWALPAEIVSLIAPDPDEQLQIDSWCQSDPVALPSVALPFWHWQGTHVLHIDIAGPLHLSDDGFTYLLVGALRFLGLPLLIDVKLLSTRTSAEVCDEFEKMVAFSEAFQSGLDIGESCRIKRLHSDQAGEGEFTALFFSRLLSNHKTIDHIFTSGYDPQANRIAERAVGLMKSLASRVLTIVSLDPSYWSYAVKYASQSLLCHASQESQKSLPFGSIVVAQVHRDVKFPSSDFFIGIAWEIKCPMFFVHLSLLTMILLFAGVVCLWNFLHEATWMNWFYLMLRLRRMLLFERVRDKKLNDDILDLDFDDDDDVFLEISFC